MVRAIESFKRHFEDLDWLQSYWLFSFSSYFDPENIAFGKLVAFNDDIVMPGKGIPMHSHEDLDIVTIMLHGEITHQDNIGNRCVLRFGDVQRMFAGSGVRHSEFNSGSEPAHFYQIWIMPQVRGIIPSYSQKHFFMDEWRNRLLPVASGRGHDDVVGLSSDTCAYICSLDRGRGVVFEPGRNRKIFVYTTSGELFVNGKQCSKGDQARIESEERIDLGARPNCDAQFVLIDLPD